MKKIVTLCVSAIALAAFAAPASAAVGGGRVEAVVGYDRIEFDLTAIGATGSLGSNGAVYGVGAGYDFAVSPKLGLGVDVEATDASTDLESGTDRISTGRDLYAGGRITAALSPKANLYFKAGYTNARFNIRTGGTTTSGDADGVRAGVGLQFALGKKAYVGGEYRYSNYEADLTRHQGVLALGFRF